VGSGEEIRGVAGEGTTEDVENEDEEDITRDDDEIGVRAVVNIDKNVWRSEPYYPATLDDAKRAFIGNLTSTE